MKYAHHHLEYEIDDRWIVEAAVVSFKPKKDCYRSTASEGVFSVRTQSVEPVTERAHSRGIFCDDRDSGETSRHRVIRILQWLRDDREISPVRVVKSKIEGYDYKLVEGCHRFHCAHAMGFQSVPAIWGFDMGDPNA